MKKSLPFLSPYLMLVLPIVMLLGLTLVNQFSTENELALDNTFSQTEQIAQVPKASSNFLKHLLKK